MNPVAIGVVEDLAGHVGAIECRIGRDAHGGGCFTGDRIARQGDHCLRAVHVFALCDAGANDEQQFQGARLGARDGETAPAEFVACHRRLSLHAVEKRRALDITESCRHAVHDGHVREHQAGDVVYRDCVWNVLSAGHVEQRCRFGNRERTCELRIERDVIVEDLARAGYPAAVQPQVSVVVCAGAAWCYRCSRRELRRLNFAEQGRSRNGIVDATWARWHRERCGRSVGRRRDDLRIARNVIRSRRGGYANDVITTAWTCWIAEVEIEFVVAVREGDLSLLCRIIEASRRQRRGATGIQQVERRPDNRGTRHRVVYHAVRLDR